MSTANGLHHAIERAHRWPHRRRVTNPRNADRICRRVALEHGEISTAFRDWHHEMEMAFARGLTMGYRG